MWQSLFKTPNAKWDQNPCITSPHYNTVLALMGINIRSEASPQAKVSITGQVACSVNILPRSCWWPQTSMVPGYLPSSPSEISSVLCSSPEMSTIPAGDFSGLFQTSESIWEVIKETGRKGPEKRQWETQAWPPNIATLSSARRFPWINRASLALIRGVRTGPWRKDEGRRGSGTIIVCRYPRR